jgi:hypothetical protein
MHKQIEAKNMPSSKQREVIKKRATKNIAVLNGLSQHIEFQQTLYELKLEQKISQKSKPAKKSKHLVCSLCAHFEFLNSKPKEQNPSFSWKMTLAKNKQDDFTKVYGQSEFINGETAYCCNSCYSKYLGKHFKVLNSKLNSDDQ